MKLFGFFKGSRKKAAEEADKVRAPGGGKSDSSSPGGISNARTESRTPSSLAGANSPASSESAAHAAAARDSSTTAAHGSKSTQPARTEARTKGQRSASSQAGKGAKARSSESVSRSGNAAAGTAATAASPAAHASAAGSDDASRDSEVLSDLDSVFGDDVKDSVRAVDVTGDDVDRASIAELFTDIAGNQLPPVKNFVFELKRGTATKEWIEICRPVIETLAEAAESLNLTAEAVPMRDFAEALGIAADGDGKLIEGTTRDLLLDSYETMSRTLPHAFALGEDTKLREVIVIHALFKQVPDVGRVTFERLYGAGLTNLGILFQAQPEELASTTGIPEWLCERICTKLAEHRAELESSSVSQDGTAQRDRLREMLAELRDLNARYEHAAESEWKDESLAAEKRESRQERQMCALRIEVLLAEMGEMDLVEQFQKASFEQRINALESWLGLGGSRESAAPAMAGAGVHGSR